MEGGRKGKGKEKEKERRPGSGKEVQHCAAIEQKRGGLWRRQESFSYFCLLYPQESVGWWK